MSFTGTLPSHFLEKIAPKDRPKGKAGMTRAQAETAFIARSEKELQKQIAAWLRRNSLPFINPPMNRRSQLPTGWPDFTFAINGRACAVEAKHADNVPSDEQIEKRNELLAADWLVATIYTYADFLAFVRQAGWKGPMQ